MSPESQFGKNRLKEFQFEFKRREKSDSISVWPAESHPSSGKNSSNSAKSPEGPTAWPCEKKEKRRKKNHKQELKYARSIPIYSLDAENARFQRGFCQIILWPHGTVGLRLKTLKLGVRGKHTRAKGHSLSCESLSRIQTPTKIQSK